MKKNYLKEFEKSGILMNPEMTQKELREGLLAFEKMICETVFGDNEYHRIDEAIIELERRARDRKVSSNPEFRKGIESLKRVRKEIAISMAGEKGEKRAAHALKYAKRLNDQYHNVYVSNGEEETEIDNIVLTESGIVILEIKNVRTDITISEDGRILYNNEECYHNVSISEKMKLKRELLKEQIEKEAEKLGMDIPVRMDSYIVFSRPRGTQITVTDNCRQEKYCFSGQLPFKIDDYCSGQLYSDEEYHVLDSIIREMESNQKSFRIELDFDTVRENIATALELIDIPMSEESKDDKRKSRLYRRAFGFASGQVAAVSSMVAGNLAVKAANTLTNQITKGVARGIAFRRF